MSRLLYVLALLASFASAQPVTTPSTSTAAIASGTIDITGTTITPVSGAAVTQGGTPGSTAYTYIIKAVLANGTNAYATASTSTGNATLGATNKNIISWTAYTGATYYVYRSASSGTPATTGLIAYTTGTTVNDTGLTVATGVSVPSTSTGGGRVGADVMRIGGYTGDRHAALGVAGDVDATGAVRSTGPDGWWETGAGVELQYVNATGFVISYDRDAAAWKPLALNYGATSAAPVVIGTNNPNLTVGDIFQVVGTARIGTNQATVNPPATGDTTLTLLRAGAGNAADNGTCMNLAGAYNSGQNANAVFGWLCGLKSGGTDNGQAGYLALGAGKQASTAAPEVMRLYGLTGDVLIGGTSDDATNKLQVTGSIKATDTQTTAKNLGTWWTPSGCNQTTQVADTNNTTENTVFACTIPQSAIGPNGRIRISGKFTVTSSSNSKTVRVKFSNSNTSPSGTTYYAAALTTVQQQNVGPFDLVNRNSASAQTGGCGGAICQQGSSSGLTTTSYDSSASATYVYFTCQKDAAAVSASDGCNIEEAIVQILYGATLSLDRFAPDALRNAVTANDARHDLAA